ncbi:MAG: DUF799 family lipoprotein [Nitrospirota bacterium]|nr:DUF799 family lipoprotein [Nitrospirota bacterium]MDE3225345.1 DUF799 family lipoprotein [Nitrospirota bacterium]MDE3241983.1 DUF799 family lipoprotein [Nitrospirota bacterium]
MKMVWLVLVVMLQLMAACAPTLPPITRNPSSPIRTIAVLPLVNNTNDVEAPAYVRELFVEELGQFYYVIKPVKDVDQLLKDRMGVTLGAQLDMATPQKLGEALGVDGVFYGALEDFNEKVTGVYNVRRVRIRSKLVDCKTGQTVWKNGIGVKQGSKAGGTMLSSVPFVSAGLALAGSASSVASGMSDRDAALPALFGDDVPAPWHELPEQASSAEMNMFAGLAGKVVEKATKSPLHMEAVTAVSILLKGYYYPGGPSYQTYGTMLVTGSGGGASETAK